MSGTRPNWDRLEAEYLRGGTTQQELADKYGLALRTVERQASKRLWADKRREVAGKVAEDLPNQVAELVTKEVGEYIAASLVAVEGALSLALTKMAAPDLEFKGLGEAMSAIAKLAKTQADLAHMTETGKETLDLAAFLDELDHTSDDKESS